MILSDVGLDGARVDLNGAAQVLWFNVIEEAERSDALLRLVDLVRTRYPSLAATIPPLGEAEKTPSPSAGSPASWRRAPGDGYDPQWHVERSEEGAILGYLESASTPCWMCGPSTIGKSWMVQRILDLLAHRATPPCVVEVSFGLMESSTSETFQRELAAQMLDRVGGDPATMDRVWSRSTSRMALTRLLELEVLPRVEGLLLLVFEVDDAPQTWTRWRELLPVLREWHRRAVRAPWDRLRMLIAVSTTPATSIDPIGSAFNIPVVELGELPAGEVRELAWRHGLTWDAAAFRSVGTLIGRADAPHPRACHPYLSRLVMWECATRDQALDDVLTLGAQGRGVFEAHLDRLRLWLDSRPDALSAFRRICQTHGTRIEARDTFVLLRDAGLVIGGSDGDHSRLPLYRALVRP